MISSKGLVLALIPIAVLLFSGAGAVAVNLSHASSSSTAQMTAQANIAYASGNSSNLTAQEALTMLMQGNARFVSGNVCHPNQSDEQRAKVVSGQQPFAVVVSCSDSRVPPEILFDQGIGDIFTVRTAGEVTDNATIGTVEYAVEHLHVPLIVVLGHDDCGAIKAAVENSSEPGQINYIVQAITPAVDTAKGMHGDLLSNSINVNAENVAAQLQATHPILAEHVQQGNLQIVPARYHLDTGAVELLSNESQG
ncbi:MAG: carbonic anhydrase [Halobacteriota archaeon]